MKKLIALLLLLCMFTLVLSSCGEKKIEKPEDTNLEYWLLDFVDKENLTLIIDLYAEEHYLAKGYEPIIDENGDLQPPEKCVMYYAMNYPLLDLGIKAISTIIITDPEVYVWGLTINSTKEEVQSVLENNGFVVSSSGDKIIANFGRYKIGVRIGKRIIVGYNPPSIIAALWSIDFD